MSPSESEDDGLLREIGYAVVSIDARLASVESSMIGRGRIRRGRRRRQPGLPTSAALRRAHRRRGDARGITWTIWAFDLLSAAERQAALHDLRRFADWINQAYALPLATWAVAPCWYRHPGAVRELWALLAAYRFAHTARDATWVAYPGDAPNLWHDRALWPCLRRLREELGLGQCAKSGRHTQSVEIAITTDQGFAGAVEKASAAWKP